MTSKAIVEVEEEIHTYTPADNGAGPLWCHGSTVVARHGDSVYVAALETLPDHQPLNNCRFLLYQRTAAGWTLVYRDETGRTREPSPLALLGDKLLVSANPTLTAPGEYGGPAEPCVFRFDANNPIAVPIHEQPRWKDAPVFTEHSYRTVTTDGSEVLYMQNTGYAAAQMSFCDTAGHWHALDPLIWPWGGEYDPPQPLRLCYPNVALRNRSAHFLGVGDIVEPVAAWKQAKHAITGRDWDYVFRRLFYAQTPDLLSEPFSAWTEVANADQTAGHMRNGDIHIDTDGTAHLIWCATNIDGRLRDRFFPDQSIIHSLEYMSLNKGQTQSRRTLISSTEGQEDPRPELARFHILEDGTPLILSQFSGPESNPSYRYALVTTDTPNWIDIPFSHPMPGTFLTSTVRGGSLPSSFIDIVGMSPNNPHTLGYARVRIEINN